MSAAADIYDDLLELDSGIAKAYKESVGKSFTGTINTTEALKIYRQASDGKKITSREAKALVRIIKAGKFEEGARDALLEEVKSKRSLLEAGTRRELTGKDLNLVGSALSNSVVKAIHFSNLRHHLFLPTHYQVIWRLILKKEITVYELVAHGLNRLAHMGGANYKPKKDQLNLYKSPRTDSWKALVVHEATHAIQDWMDRKGMPVREVEADAYTAQGVACHQLGVFVSTDLTHPLACAYHGTSRLIYEPGLRNSANFRARFETAYKELVGVISNYPLYSWKEGVARDYTDDDTEDEESEKASFNKIHRALKKKR